MENLKTNIIKYYTVYIQRQIHYTYTSRNNNNRSKRNHINFHLYTNCIRNVYENLQIANKIKWGK